MRIYAFFTSLIMLHATYGFEPEADLSLSELLKVELSTGSFLELDLMNSPVSMTVIKKDQIRYSGARHLTELRDLCADSIYVQQMEW